MRIQDMTRFQAVMASLGDVFTRLVSPQTVDLYWVALKDLPIEVVEMAAASCIKHAKHFPKPGDIRARHSEMTAAAPKPVIENTPPLPKWLGIANGIFLRYLLRRRVDEKFDGDFNLTERRKACLSLAEIFEGLEAESDPEATKEEMQKRLDRMMARIPDFAAAA